MSWRMGRPLFELDDQRKHAPSLLLAIGARFGALKLTVWVKRSAFLVHGR